MTANHIFGNFNTQYPQENILKPSKLFSVPQWYIQYFSTCLFEKEKHGPEEVRSKKTKQQEFLKSSLGGSNSETTIFF